MQIIVGCPPQKEIDNFAQCLCKAVGIDGGLRNSRIIGAEAYYDCLQGRLVTTKL